MRGSLIIYTAPRLVSYDVKTLPFEVSYGQTLEINITKLDVATTAYLTLMGNTK